MHAMPISVRITESYTHQKNAFISANNHYLQLISVIKRLERNMLGIQHKQLNSSDKFQLILFSKQTGFGYVSLARIVCLLLFNSKTDELAPCGLFFEGQLALTPPGRNSHAMLVKAVKAELGW